LRRIESVDALIKAPRPSAANLLPAAGFCAGDLTAVLRLCISQLLYLQNRGDVFS
jgi:hypothetical protein